MNVEDIKETLNFQLLLCWPGFPSALYLHGKLFTLTEIFEHQLSEKICLTRRENTREEITAVGMITEAGHSIQLTL